jgi:hypothetical protein
MVGRERHIGLCLALVEWPAALRQPRGGRGMASKSRVPPPIEKEKSDGVVFAVPETYTLDVGHGFAVPGAPYE